MLTRILVISAFVPFPPTNGFTMRVSAMVEAYGKLGASVRLLCFGDELAVSDQPSASHLREVEVIPHPIASMSQAKDYLRRLGTVGSRMPHAVTRFQSERMKKRVAELARTGRFDAIVCETPYMLVNVPPDLGIPVILSSHNVESSLLWRYVSLEKNPLKRWYASLEARKMTVWEQTAFAGCQAAIACSEIDANAIRQMCPALPIFDIPNAIDSETYKPFRSTDSSTLLYLGGMDWFPNRDAVEYFAQEIFPQVRGAIPNARFVIAGRSPSERFRRHFEHIPGVEFTGTQPDLRPSIGAATVVVVPLRIGSGTRFKILEAAAMEKPIVSTRLGAEGLNFRDGDEIVLADEPRAFAREVVSLLRDPERCTGMARAARRRVDVEYSFTALEASVTEMLGALAGQQPAYVGP